MTVLKNFSRVTFGLKLTYRKRNNPTGGFSELTACCIAPKNRAALIFFLKQHNCPTDHETEEESPN